MGNLPQRCAIEQLSQLRCYLHASREAVCRCPQCRHYFCRECVTEHEQRFVCSACLKAILLAEAPKEAGQRDFFKRLAQPVLLLISLLAAWIFFYGVGQALLAIASPSPTNAVYGYQFKSNPAN
jgi:hypothetical protein